MSKTHYGKAKQYPYYVKFNSGGVSGVFKTKKEAIRLIKNKYVGGPGKIIKRRR